MQGCEKKEIIIQDSNPIEKQSTGKEIKLGKKIGMSTSLVNIKKCMKKLGYASKADGLEANAKYIKIVPSSPEEISYIDTSTNFAIYDYPLDYEIPEEGDYYIEPGIADTVYNPRYAIVENEINIPDYVNYEVSEDIRIPETEVEAAAYLYTQIIAGEIELPADKDTTENIDENKSGWYPKLKIVYGSINMSYIKIKIGTHVYTLNSLGEVNCNKKHYGQIKVSGRFETGTATIRKGFFEIIGIDRYDDIKKVSQSSNRITINITKSGVLNQAVRHKAAIYAGILRYNSYCSTNGIQPACCLNVWTSSSLSGAACPLFRRLASNNLPMLQDFCTTYALGLGLDASTLFDNNLAPDILIDEFEEQMDYDIFLFHELSHFSHAVKRGWNFWRNIVDGEIQCMALTPIDPYGNGTQPTPIHADYIGLAESWANFMEAKIGNFYSYGTSVESFQPRTIPFTPSDGLIGWMPVGVYWDILDNNSDFIELKDNNGNPIAGRSGNDNINGISLNITVTNLYNIITNSSCNSVSNFKTLFYQQYPNLTTQSNLLFSFYGY